MRCQNLGVDLYSPWPYLILIPKPYNPTALQPRRGISVNIGRVGKAADILCLYGYAYSGPSPPFHKKASFRHAPDLPQTRTSADSRALNQTYQQPKLKTHADLPCHRLAGTKKGFDWDGVRRRGAELWNLNSTLHP